MTEAKGRGACVLGLFLWPSCYKFHVSFILCLFLPQIRTSSRKAYTDTPCTAPISSSDRESVKRDRQASEIAWEELSMLEE